jgi:hypothetical protein
MILPKGYEKARIKVARCTGSEPVWDHILIHALICENDRNCSRFAWNLFLKYSLTLEFPITYCFSTVVYIA